MLDDLGIPPEEEAVYEALLGRPVFTGAQFAGIAGGDARRAAAMRESMLARGLIRAAGADTFVAVPPEVCLERAALDFEYGIHRAKLRVAELAALHRHGPGAPQVPAVEVVPGEEAPGRLIECLASAQQQICSLETPPYVHPPAANTLGERDALRRGVRCRGVYDRAALRFQTLDMLRGPMVMGEETRVIDTVPLRLLVIDDRLALLPAGTRRPVTEGLLVVRERTMVDGLAALFEAVWSRALPIHATPGDTSGTGGASATGGAPGAGGVDGAGGALSGTAGGAASAGAPAGTTDFDVAMLVALLAGGLNDEAIAGHFGLGVRTVRRRIQELLARLGAGTRFQAGVAVGRAQRDDPAT